MASSCTSVLRNVCQGSVCASSGSDRGRILEANRAASALLGYARPYCLGKPLRALAAAGERDRLAAVLERAAALTDGKVHEPTLRFRPVRRSREIITAV